MHYHDIITIRSILSAAALSSSSSTSLISDNCSHELFCSGREKQGALGGDSGHLGIRRSPGNGEERKEMVDKATISETLYLRKRERERAFSGVSLSNYPLKTCREIRYM